MLKSIQIQYHNLCVANNVDVSHGLVHANAVLQHVKEAMRCSDTFIPPKRAFAVELAALLHDADDRKYFDTENCANARMIMENAHVPSDIVDSAVHMIDYVSGSKNGNSIPDDCIETPELLYPRWADRLEAIGTGGVVRCWQYNVKKNKAVSSETTPKPKTHDEALELVTNERFEAYQQTGESKSMIDHYYDKLLHVVHVKPEMVRNAYLEHQLKNNVAPLLDVCVIYANRGEEAVIDHIQGL